MRLSQGRFWLTILLPFGLGFFITAAFRSINAILAGPIMHSLDLNAVEIGWVTATFSLTVALTQLPLGVSLDHIGPRKTQSLFFLVGGSGMILFALAPNITVLALGRGILGIGAAGGLMAAYKALSEWAPHRKIPLYGGIILAAGGIGGLVATSPSKYFEDLYGWRSLCILLGAFTYAIALLIFFIVPDKPGSRGQTTILGQIKGIKKVLKNRYFWQITPLFMTSFGGFVAMQGLWLGPWLEKVVGLTPVASADLLFLVALGMTCGMLSGGLFSMLAQWLKISLAAFVAWGIVIHIATQLLIVWNVFGSSSLVWFVFSYFAQVTLVNYALVTQHFGPTLSGRATTMANISVFLFAFALQTLFGVVLHALPGTVGYRVAFLGLIALECLALLWFFLSPRVKSGNAKMGEIEDSPE